MISAECVPMSKQTTQNVFYVHILHGTEFKMFHVFCHREEWKYAPCFFKLGPLK